MTAPNAAVVNILCAFLIGLINFKMMIKCNYEFKLQLTNWLMVEKSNIFGRIWFLTLLLNEVEDGLDLIWNETTRMRNGSQANNLWMGRTWTSNRAALLNTNHRNSTFSTLKYSNNHFISKMATDRQISLNYIFLCLTHSN